MVAVYQLCRQVRSHCMLHHTQHTQIHKFTNTQMHKYTNAQMHKCACPILKMYFSKLKIIFGLQTGEVTGIVHPWYHLCVHFQCILDIHMVGIFQDGLYVCTFFQPKKSLHDISLHTYIYFHKRRISFCAWYRPAPRIGLHVQILK